MILLLIIIILLVVLLLLWLFNRYRLRKFKQQQKNSLEKQLRQRFSKLSPQVSSLDLTTLQGKIPTTAIWHNNIFVYEFMVADPDGKLKSLSQQKLETWLNQNLQLATEIAVTECWWIHGHFHFDVAVLLDQATINYVHDMQRVSQSDDERGDRR